MVEKGSPERKVTFFHFEIWSIIVSPHFCFMVMIAAQTLTKKSFLKQWMELSGAEQQSLSSRAAHGFHQIQQLLSPGFSLAECSSHLLLNSRDPIVKWLSSPTSAVSFPITSKSSPFRWIEGSCSFHMRWLQLMPTEYRLTQKIFHTVSSRIHQIKSNQIKYRKLELN